MSTLIFSPKAQLEYNTDYTFALKLGSLFDDVPTDLQRVNFPFKTRAMDYTINLYAINYDIAKDELLTLKGRIKSNDYVTNKDVETLLNASQSGNNDIDILWTHTKDGRRHHFEVVNIQRKKTPSEVNLNWNDKIHNTGFEGSRRMTIHPKGDFKVIASEASKGNNRKITVSFTEPIKKSQDLAGLIRINGYNGELRIIKLCRMIGALAYRFPVLKGHAGIVHHDQGNGHKRGASQHLCTYGKGFS